MSYELADGKVAEHAFGLVQISFMGEITAGRVIFGPDDAEPILGVTALESVGITIDPANRTLKRLPAIPLSSRSRCSDAERRPIAAELSMRMATSSRRITGSRDGAMAKSCSPSGHPLSFERRSGSPTARP